MAFPVCKWCKVQGARHKEKIYSVCLFLHCTLYLEPCAVLLRADRSSGPGFFWFYVQIDNMSSGLS